MLVMLKLFVHILFGSVSCLFRSSSFFAFVWVRPLIYNVPSPYQFCYFVRLDQNLEHVISPAIFFLLKMIDFGY